MAYRGVSDESCGWIVDAIVRISFISLETRQGGVTRWMQGMYTLRIVCLHTQTIISLSYCDKHIAFFE